MTQKEKAWKACSRYIRLRDALEYCKERDIDLHQFTRPEDVIGRCATCGTVKSWIRMDAGHFISRGIGGGSGVYFDERNIHLQCKQCNKWGQGKYTEYQEFMVKKYSRSTVWKLTQKQHFPLDASNLTMLATEQYYKDRYKELLTENGL